MIICHKNQSIVGIKDSFRSTITPIIINIRFTPCPPRSRWQVSISILIFTLGKCFAGSNNRKISKKRIKPQRFCFHYADIIIWQFSKPFQPPIRTIHFLCCSCPRYNRLHHINTTATSIVYGRLRIWAFFDYPNFSVHFCAKDTPFEIFNAYPMLIFCA